MDYEKIVNSSLVWSIATSETDGSVAVEKGDSWRKLKSTKPGCK